MMQLQCIGKYELLAELGRGGFAVVYKARDTKMERDIALKVITGNFTDDATFIQRFRQEARTAANLCHRHIVPVYDFGEVDGRLYLAMPLIGGGRTLRELLNEQAPLSLGRALPLLIQLAAALDYLHQHEPSLIHRDIKPANVLLEGTGESLWVMLTDFGLVHSLQASAELTRSNSILGMPAYMAPEQADSKRWGEATPLADVYALGVVTYEMLTGRAPFAGETPSVLHAHAYEPPPSPLELLPDLGDDLSDVLLRALRKPPAERYPSAGAFVAALQAAADARSEAVVRESTLEQLETQAEALLAADKWAEALSCCAQIISLDAARPAAQEMLTRATQGWDKQQAEAVQRRRRAEQYETGMELFQAEKWQQAVVAFEVVADGNPDFRDVQEKLAQAQDEMQRAQWYDEAIAHGEAERWAEACRAWVRVLRDRLDYHGGEAAKRLLEDIEVLLNLHNKLDDSLGWELRILASYEKLAVAVAGDDWQEILEAGEELLKMVPELKGAQIWTERARQQLQIVARRAAQARNGNTLVWEQDGKEMVRIPAGEFLYGNEQEKRELPEFWIDKTPVTNAEYARFVAATDRKTPKHWKSKTPPEKIVDHPVIYVSWHDATAYAEWAGKRLPTEEEWEKAARGADGLTYPWGDEKPTPELCNFGRNEGGATPVGKYSPQGDSPYGCVDMAGNVWEWTSSDYNKSSKVLRGGSWIDNPNLVRSAYRYWNDPVSTWSLSGFRCADRNRPDPVNTRKIHRFPSCQGP